MAKKSYAVSQSTQKMSVQGVSNKVVSTHRMPEEGRTVNMKVGILLRQLRNKSRSEIQHISLSMM